MGSGNDRTLARRDADLCAATARTLAPATRLNARISALRPGDVMLVAAFAGSGKTTFLADWYTNDREIDGAWLTLDARDNAPGRLAGLIAHALGCDAEAPAPAPLPAR